MKRLSSEFCNDLYRIAREHNGENAQVDLNGVPVLIVQRLEDADWVLRRNADNYRKNMAWFRQSLGKSRFSEDGDAWKIRRDLTQPFFSKFDRDRTFALATHYADQIIERLAADSAGGALTISDDLLREMAVSVLIENFFGLKLSDTTINMRHLAELMEYGSEYSFVPAGQTGAMYQERLKQLPELRRKVLADFKPFRDGRVKGNALLDGLIAADLDPNSGIVLEQELMTFFAAGAETTAATVGWACDLLAMHPDIQTQLRHATDAFWQSSTPDWAQLSQINPLTAFISETLRLYPPTPIIARLAVEADSIGEIDIKPGQNVLISFIGIQHDARLHSQPWQLNMDEGGQNPHTRDGSGINTAFSFGPRVCGGKNFALVELAGFLSVFLSRAEFTATSDAEPVFHWKSQMLREGGHPVRVTLRDGITVPVPTI